MGNMTAPGIEHSFGANHEWVEESRGPLILGFASVLLGMSIVVVMLRLYTRCRVLGSIGWDDHCILVALLLSIGHAACIILSVAVGDNGKHSWMIKDLAGKAVFNFKLVYAGSILQYTCMGVLRSSIVCFLLRLSPTPRLRIILCVLLGAVISLATSATFITAFRCRNPTDMWARKGTVESQPQCMNPIIMGYIIPALGMAVNVLIYIVPLPLMWRLDLPARQRIGLIVAFELGALGLVGSILQLGYSREFMKSMDPLWDNGPIVICLLIEIHMMMIGSSLPILKALWIHLFDPPPPPSDGITELESHDYSQTYTKPSSSTAALSPSLPTFTICPFSRRSSKATASLPPPSNLTLSLGLDPQNPPIPEKSRPRNPAIQTFDPDFFLPTPPSTPLPSSSPPPLSSLPFSFSQTTPLDYPPNIDPLTPTINNTKEPVKTPDTSFSYGNTDPLPPTTTPIAAAPTEDVRYEPTVPSPVYQSFGAAGVHRSGSLTERYNSGPGNWGFWGRMDRERGG